MSTLATTKKTSRVSTAKPGRYKTGQMDIYFLGSNLVILADNLLHLIKKFRIVIFSCPGLTIVIGGQIIFWNKGKLNISPHFRIYNLSFSFRCRRTPCFPLQPALSRSRRRISYVLFQRDSCWPRIFMPDVLFGRNDVHDALCRYCHGLFPDYFLRNSHSCVFVGGSFGYVRCTLGPVVGYLVGCCESAEYILYVATAVAEVGRLTTIITQLSPSFEPLYWMAFYIISLVIQCKGGRIFWRFNAVVAIVTTLLIVIHCLAALPQVDFSRYAIDEERDYAGFGSSASFLDTMYYFPLVCWFYVGVEAMTLSCDDIPQVYLYIQRFILSQFMFGAF